MSEEIYPMPLVPTLIVSNLEASSKFYQEALGFKHIFTMPGPGGWPVLVHLRWVKHADLLLALPRDGQQPSGLRGVGVSINFNLFGQFAGDPEAFANHAREHGANVTGPITRPWNAYEVLVIDPDGYQLSFTVPINQDLGFDAVLNHIVNSGKA